MEGPEIIFAEATIDNGKFGTRTIRFETGRLAKQADGAVVAYLDDDTMIMATTAAGRTPKDQFDFFPLTVDVEERMYAIGKIPGSFFRREGRPSTEAILTCRLIDRPLRPSFVKGLRNEVQIIITVYALNPDHQYDVVAINAASAATQISGLPFSGPIGGVRVSCIDGHWVAFPNFSDAERSTFDMVVAGRIVGDDVAIMMVEAESTEATWDLVKHQGKTAPTEEVVAEGLEAAKKFIKVLCEAQAQLAAEAAKPVQEFPVFLDYTDDVYAAVEAEAAIAATEAMTIAGKQEREDRLSEIKDAVLGALAVDGKQFEGRDKEVSAAYRSLQKALVRQRILRDKVRIDGRGLADIRALSAEVEVIPRVHGSAIFERGETQIMGVTTLNMLKMEQQIDSLNPVTKKRYLHHYNFPPYSTGETGRVGSPKRREIGHGFLAERALVPVLPSREEFPYAIRQVSEALGSNGSTSMGSVCASTLSLMDAGVPIKAPVAGIAMGLVYAEGKYTTLTDILGAEDAFGDMDFKVAGTADAITALQLDTKIEGIPADVLTAALEQAKEARLAILDNMNACLSAPRAEVAATAPKITTIFIPMDKIGEVIGPKGKVINTIQQETGADIAVDDDGAQGIVTIGAVEAWRMEEAKARIQAIVSPPMAEVGASYQGRVVNLTKFGAFINILPGRDGLVHISKLGKGKRINNVEDVLTLGQEIEVIVEDVDEKGKVSLTPGESWNPVIPEGAASSGGGDRDRGDRDRGDRDRGDRDRGDRDRGPRRERSSVPAAAPAAATTDGVAVSFDDAFDAELAGDLGDLGPGGEAGGNAGGGDRGDRGGDRGRRRHR